MDGMCIASFRTNLPNRDALLAAAPVLRLNGTENHPRAKAGSRTRNVERPGKATQSHPEAIFRPSGSQPVATLEPP